MVKLKFTGKRYAGFDPVSGKNVDAQTGMVVEVSLEKAAQLLKDFAGQWEYADASVPAISTEQPEMAPGAPEIPVTEPTPKEGENVAPGEDVAEPQASKKGKPAKKTGRRK